VLIVVAIVVLLDYPSFLLVGTYDQYHNLHGQTREAMVNAWNNPFGFSVGWMGVMLYFAGALVCLIVKIRKENQRYGLKSE
jgi:hypothetical protein